MRYKNYLLLGALFIASCTKPSIEEIKKAYPVKFDTIKSDPYYGITVEYLSEDKRKISLDDGQDKELLIATLGTLGCQHSTETDSGYSIGCREEAIYRKLSGARKSKARGENTRYSDKIDVLYDEPKLFVRSIKNSKGQKSAWLIITQKIYIPKKDYKNYKKAHEARSRSMGFNPSRLWEKD